jgi:hypothetical protein
MRKAIDKTVKMNITEVKYLLEFIIENNSKLQEIGIDPISLNISGPSGIGKTSLIKQTCDKLGIHSVKKNLAQIDDLGEIMGFPIKEYEVTKIEGDKTKARWIPEAVLTTATDKGWTPTTRTRMGYAKPEWLTTNEKMVLILDDFNRCQPRFMQAIMEIVDNQSYFSWKLPKGSTIVLSSNPDNGDYNVTTEDTAQTSRYFRVDCKFDANIWAKYAEAIGIDERCINFVLLHPEMVNDNCNARIVTKFFNSIRFIKDFAEPSSLLLIQSLGEISVGSVFVTTFTQFIHDKLDKMVTPKYILETKDFNIVQYKIKELVGQGSNTRLDIASVLSHRLINYTTVLFEKKEFKPEFSLRIGEIIEQNDLLPSDLVYLIARELVGANRNRFLNILTKPAVAQKILI